MLSIVDRYDRPSMLSTVDSQGGPSMLSIAERHSRPSLLNIDSFMAAEQAEHKRHSLEA